jgi:hypothetical protein
VWRTECLQGRPGQQLLLCHLLLLLLLLLAWRCSCGAGLLLPAAQQSLPV